MGHRVDGVDLVLIIEIRVEPVHHHDHFLPDSVFRRAVLARPGDGDGLGIEIGVQIGVRVDDEAAIKALMNMPF